MKWLWALLFIGAGFSHSASAQVKAQVEPERADVRVIIDISGSMKQNDPQDLRRPALDLLIKLIPEGSKAGVWTFGQYVNMLIPHKDVDEPWRKAAAEQVHNINSVGLYTNIGGALERVVKDGGKPLPGYHTSIILLTDGMVDISREPDDNVKEWRRIVDQVLPSLKDEHYTIHTVALSANADTELMNALSLGTDGIAAVAPSAEELSRIFLRALAQSAPHDEVPLSENKFLVDSSIEEFTALIFRAVPEQQTQLLSPDKKFYQADTQDKYLSWYRASDHDVITVKQPIEGEWLVRADLDPESKITIVTNLKLLVKPMPNNLFEGEQAKLQFLLQDQGETLTDARFLRLLNVHATLTRDGAEVWSEQISDQLPPGDGLYRRDLKQFDQEGDYRLRLQLDGQSFSREFSHRFVVRAPFSVALLNGSGSERLVRVSANGQNINRKKMVVVAKVKDPSGRSSIQPMRLSDTDSWELVIAPTDPGLYQVDIRISDVDNDGVDFDYNPEPLSFTYGEGQDLFADAAEPTDSTEEKKPVPEPAIEVADKTDSPVDTPIDMPEGGIVEPEIAAELDQKWVLYGALGLGNLLILALAFFAYRTLMGGKKVEANDLDIEREDDLNAPAPKATKAKAEIPDALKLEDLDDGESTEDLADSLMAPLDDENSTNSSIASVDLESDTAADELADIDDATDFSLDDLAPKKSDK